MDQLALTGVCHLDSSPNTDSTDFSGIEAHDVSSLLLQFEEASHSSEDSGLGSLPPSQGSQDRNEPVKPDFSPLNDKPTDSPSKTSPGKLKLGVKRKGAILLPMGVPSGRGRGNPVTIPAHCSSPKLQKILLKNAANQEPNVPNQKTKRLEDTACSLMKPKSDKPEFNCGSGAVVSQFYYSEISDHDYCQNFPHSISKTRPSQELGESSMDKDEILQLEDPAAAEFDQPSASHIDSTQLNCSKLHEATAKRKISHKEYKHRRRNYRKHIPENEQCASTTKFFDKIPSYFTTLSLPTKPPKKDPKAEQAHCGIKVTDFIPREIAPSLSASSDVYNKLPAYHNCFINSTKYDDTCAPQTVSEIEIQKLKNTKYPWDKLRDKLNNDQSRSQSPLLLAENRRESKSREISCSPPRSRSVSRSRNPRQYRDTSVSSCSSRSSSRSSRSSSRSHRSSSSEHGRHKNRRSRRERHRERHRRRRERGHSYSSYSSRSSDSEWSDYSRSRSRSYSRSRSRSRSRSPRYRRQCRRDASYERRREQRQRQREEEKKRQIEERRIVYVGKIPETFTRRQLRERFYRFGEIEETSVHFRETGDNYGFVTYAYTCDAYAAIEHGNKVAGGLQFDLCFGGRREFCATDYADLDGQVEEEEELYGNSQKTDVLDFDQLLKDAKRKLMK